MRRGGSWRNSGWRSRSIIERAGCDAHVPGMSNDTDDKPLDAETVAGAAAPPKQEPEIGGPKGPEPTRYGDWTVKGRCIDF